jgi:hypothetical protein
MSVGLDRKRLVAALPDAAGRLVSDTVLLYVRREEPVHPPGKVAVPEGANDDVQVIRHQAPRQNLDADGRLGVFIRRVMLA